MNGDKSPLKDNTPDDSTTDAVHPGVEWHHEDERSPLAPEDDHSNTDFDIAEEVEAKLGLAGEPSLSPPAPVVPALSPASSAEDPRIVYDDERSPMECEDDHSGADFDITGEVETKFGGPREPSLPACPAEDFTGEDLSVYDDEYSPMEYEDDHSGADFDIAEEVDAKLGSAREPSLSPPLPACPVENGTDDDHGAHDDDHSPMECEDDHSGADDVHAGAAYAAGPTGVLDNDLIHPGLAAALNASLAYAQNGVKDDGDAPSPANDPVGELVDDDACAPLDPEDSGEGDDTPPDAPGSAGEPAEEDADADRRAAEDGAAKTARSMDAAIAAAAAEAGGADEEEDADDDDNDDDEEEDAEDKPMTLRDHLTELRKRLFRVFMWVMLGFIICYPFAEQLFEFLFLPLTDVLKTLPDGGSKLIYTSPPEAFFTFMKVAFVGGIFCTSPLVFYQIWAFIAPGLYKEEKLYVLPVAIFSAIFFISGGAFCYFVVFPFAFEFFMSYNRGIIQALPSLSETLSFVLQLLLAFGLVFELPLFVFFLARLGIVTADMMRRFRRYAILVMVIIAAILTPPDVLSQLLMAGPLMLLYEASILIAAVFGKKKKETLQEESDDDEEEDDDEKKAPRSIAAQQEQPR